MTALQGRMVAISISDAPDRARLGFPQREVDRALLSLCTALVRAGADIAYGGNLDPDGYTFKIFRHLAGAYAGSRDAPFHHFIPEPVLRRTRYEDFLAVLREATSTVRTEVARGNEFVPVRPGDGGIRVGAGLVRSEADLVEWMGHVPMTDMAVAHTVARRLVVARADARVVLGGKMGVLADPNDSYQGEMPGVIEEAILTLESGKPLVALGSFGGAARDIAIALGLMPQEASVPRSEQHDGYKPALERVAELRGRIPEQLRDRLAKVADDDRAEQTAFEVSAILTDWISKDRPMA